MQRILDEVGRSGDSYFDTVLACDCLFFEDFHDALLDIILLALGCHTSQRSARTANSSRGKALLFQPSRGGSMERFIDKAVPHFSIETIEDYDDEVGMHSHGRTIDNQFVCQCDIQVTRQRQEYLREENSTYKDGIHYPVLLVLTPREELISGVES
jgi:hypothetical protein